VREYRLRIRTASKPSELAPRALLRTFDVSHPNEACVTDITYIRTCGGWLYLAVVMDSLSRKIIGRATRPTLGREASTRRSGDDDGAVRPADSGSGNRSR